MDLSMLLCIYLLCCLALARKLIILSHLFQLELIEFVCYFSQNQITGASYLHNRRPAHHDRDHIERERADRDRERIHARERDFSKLQ